MKMTNLFDPYIIEDPDEEDNDELAQEYEEYDTVSGNFDNLDLVRNLCYCCGKTGGNHTPDCDMLAEHI